MGPEMQTRVRWAELVSQGQNSILWAGGIHHGGVYRGPDFGLIEEFGGRRREVITLGMGRWT